MRIEIEPLPHAIISFNSFCSELGIILAHAGIHLSYQPITAGGSPKANGVDYTFKRDPAIGRVIIYMQEHLTEPLSLDKLADEAQLSKYQLIRQFKDEEGLTPWKFLIGKRLDKVKMLLEDGVPPSQAAVETGFYDQSHLTKIFHKETGFTPKQYQEKHFKNRN